MVFWVYLFCSFFVLAASEPNERSFYDLNEAEQHFEEFIIKFNKKYDNSFEKLKRFQIFKEKLHIINEKNKKNESVIYGINDFSDMSTEEFQRNYMNCGMDLNITLSCASVSLPSKLGAIPQSFDWRGKNVITPVKDQHGCGSCWAFSAIGALESQYALKYKQLQEFSVKQLVDCDASDRGCTDGIAGRALDYLRQNGAMLESSYPYIPQQGPCRYNANAVVARITGCNRISNIAEDDLRAALVTYGPLAISVFASNVFQRYHRGILPLADCPPYATTHAALLVGYGQEGNTPYWIIKNSYGLNWGQQGYMRMVRNQNVCNMMGSPIVVPTVQ